MILVVKAKNLKEFSLSAMNTACSNCLEPYSSREDISYTPCGHVFHTECIKNLFQNGRNYCLQCRKDCELDQGIELYFSGSGLSHNLLRVLNKKN